MQPTTPSSFENGELLRDDSLRELTDIELAEQESHNQRLNHLLYGESDEYSSVESVRNRSTSEDLEGSQTLAAVGQESSMSFVAHELGDMHKAAQEHASRLGGAIHQADRVSFGDIDTRVADATRYAQATNRIGEQGMLYSDDRLRAEKATAMEVALQSYIEGRNPELLSDIEESARNKILVQIGQLLEKYGDISKTSNKELEDLFGAIESAKGTLSEAVEQSEVVEQPETKTDVIEQIKEVSQPTYSNEDEGQSYESLTLRAARQDAYDVYAAIEAQKNR